MNYNSKHIGTGVLAGLAAALLASGVLVQSGLAMVLYVLTPLPIFIAALGWGTAAGLIAAATASIAVAIFAAPMVAVLIALTSFIPAATGAYLAGLARPAQELGGPKDALVWYPLPDIMFRLALLIAVSFIIVGAIIGYGEEMVRELTGAMIASLQASDPEFSASDDFRAMLQQFLLFGLPAIQAATSLMFLTANFYLALRITERSGVLRRPRDNWPATLRMPRPALLIFALTFAGSMFLSGPASMIATTFAGALAAGFIMAGLAIIHWRTRGATWRPFALWLAYFLLIIFAFSALVFLVFGLLDTSRGAPLSKDPSQNS
ncbi:DUF2232 domain-containing protein [Pseudochrobactrum kiredjianiae]|uniref:DUF2232 domain-containing protein n=1 Tax=Pseudochrobactrum kiredjianiae TaxID=386305 RepID=A0ABW3V973_9HYPH|nr:DUF2232 domain-containing protein [Pseudochrobactrum kiredjianiae]MDM7850581.1 DUF2232 domain-containing protein [Pseudochrobactrum kiredjianiae]